MSTSYTFKPNNSLEKFRKIVSGKSNEPRDIDCVLTPSGDFRVLEGMDAIIRSLTTLLVTSSGTYLFDPPLGLGLFRYIFEPKDELTKNSIENEVNAALRRYESRIQVSFNVVFLSNRKGFRLDFSIKYQGKHKKVYITIDESLLRTLPQENY